MRMKKEPLDYQSVTTRREDPTPRVRFQTIVSCSLLGLAIVCALVALVWTHRRSEFLAATISLGAAGAIVHLPYGRM